MTTIHTRAIATLAIAVAAAVAAAPAFAQACVGTATARKHSAGVESHQSWTSPGRDTRVYGGWVASRFNAGKGVGITTNLSVATRQRMGDSSAGYVAATVGVDRHLTELNERVSVCLASGMESRGQDMGDGGLFMIPIRLGFGYDIDAMGVRITPYAMRTVARYGFEDDAVADGVEQWGWNSYNTYGVTTTIGRFTVGAAYRNADNKFSQDGPGRPITRKGSMVFRTGIGF